MKKQFFFAAVALVALASCSSEEIIGDSPTPNSEKASEAIVFNSGTKTVTRSTYYGKDAADKLNGKFIVGGFKGTGSATTFTDATNNLDGVPATSTVFDNYQVVWKNNSAGTTESNTSDWEYVGTMPNGTDPINAIVPSTLAGNAQTIKYWDYSADQYDFIAYSTGNAAVIITGTPSTGQVLVKAIDAANAGKVAGAYTLTGDIAGLQQCYIADMVTVYKNGADPKYKYRNEVPFVFRSLVSKVRIALYETVPGYSVKDVRFYTDATTNLAVPTNATGDDLTASKKATLFTTGTTAKDNFYTSGEYKVYFPTIGSTNINNSDYNKAHVIFDKTGGSKGTTLDLSTINYGAAQSHEKTGGTIWLGRNSKQASFAGDVANNYYTIVLPNEEGTVLELRIDYTLESIDGSGEEIHVYGATAYVPAIYSAWKPNFAYTYLFKISDNTNGWTHEASSPSNPTDPAGLYPITFDAIVLETEDNTQSTITNVATPSITTYQKEHVYTQGTDESADPKGMEYDHAKGDIYIQVMKNDGTLATNLNTAGISKLYTLTGLDRPTEADVLDALNLQVSATGDPLVITGRNGLVLTTATIANDIVAIPGADGNTITVTAGTAAKFSPAAGIYAYVYDTGTYGSDYYPTEPAGWPTGYYTDATCGTAASGAFSAGTYYRMSSDIYSANTIVAADEEGWSTAGWYEDPDGKTAAGVWAASNVGKTFYKKYTVNNKIYGVKIIRVK